MFVPSASRKPWGFVGEVYSPSPLRGYTSVMGAPYSDDLRLRVVAAVDSGLSKTQVHRTFGVSRSAIDDWLKLRATTGGVTAKTTYYRGRRPMLVDSPALRTFIAEHQGNTLAQLSQAWSQEQGQQVSVKRFIKPFSGWATHVKKDLPIQRTRPRKARRFLARASLLKPRPVRLH
jgi:transposase